MKECLEKMAKHISENVFAKWVNNAIANDDDITIQMIVGAYNAYQENERGSVDYIFDLDNKDDLRTCVEGGLTAKEISKLYDESLCDGRTKLFMFGVNHTKPVIMTKHELKTALSCFAEEIITNMIMYPHTYDCLTYRIIVSDPLTCNTHREALNTI